ncbi:MAG: transcriptional regulator of sugar metabolism [Bacilli bacterium]|nr:transcriptional regulator of sugar metabolism [Bacilli bacterium]
MFSEERRDQILNLLEANGRVFAKELAEMFQMSIDSIRRDLSIMEENGLLKRTHGGAIPMTKDSRPAPPAIRFGEGDVYQNAIAKSAASYIQQNDSVFIGGAAQNFVMLKYLPQVPFTVVTNSLRVADVLRENHLVQTYFVGGQLKPSGNVTDALAHEFIRQFKFDTCFLVGGGLSSRGISTLTPEVAAFHRVIAQNSRTRICLASHNKIGFDLFITIVSIDQLDLIITDEETPRDKIANLEANGIPVIVAQA